jgi:uncharacterized protein (DUF433 family)
MSLVLAEAEKLIATMSRAEKEQLLQWLETSLGDVHPGIVADPAVCDGEACVIRTCIPVWMLEHARRQGASEASLLETYPTLKAEDLVHVWAYVRAHSSEIETKIREKQGL